MEFNKLLKNWRIIILMVSLALAVILLSINGLNYGIDFVGGYEMQLELDWGGVNESNRDIEVVKSILEQRLNSFGLKDISVRSWGNNNIKIQVANATPSEIKKIEDILKQQARFEERIDGEVAVYGDEISIELGAMGSVITKSQYGYDWRVVVKHNPEGACRFGKVATGKKGRPVDTFIDRPENTLILMSKDTYRILNDMRSLSTKTSGDVAFGDSAVELIEKRSNISIVVVGVNRLKEEKKEENDTNASENENNTYTYLTELEKYRSQGINNVIVAGDDVEISEEIRNELESNGFNTKRIAKQNTESYGDWICEIIGLKNAPTLQFDPRGTCTYEASISGSTRGDVEDAKDEIQRIQALLSSGNLPAKPTIGSKSIIPPRLDEFLKYSLIAGLAAILMVAIFVYLRYRRLFIVIPIMITCISEILLILGLASAISWQLDLAAIAGIIAAVGTGVDDQIIITDETLKRRKGAREKVVSITEQIGRAFFIIFTAAATTIAAMIPLLALGMGMLKGFAFTTIMGVLLGVFIARPAYAAIIEFLLKRQSK